MAKRKWLMCRFGGIGDLMFITGVANIVKETYPEDVIHLAVREAEQVSVVNNLPFIDKVYEIRRFPHPMLGSNCVKCGDGWETLEGIKERYDMPIDFVNSIENNTMHRQMIPKLGEWVQSQNSNYVNAYDMALGWCNIDPEKVDPSKKRPVYIVTEKEREWAQKIIGNLPKPVIGVHMFASSRARSYFNPKPLLDEILEAYSEGTVVFWTGDTWMAVRKGGASELSKKPSLRQSAALVEQMNALVCADSGLSHIAEGMGKDSVTIYSTVPAWTRNKYYLNAHDVQIDIKCGPCFTLHANCPVNRTRAQESLSDREQQIIQLANSGQPPEMVATHLNTTPDKLLQEFQAIQAKVDGVASVIPDCIASITPDMIVEKLDKIINPDPENVVSL